jgi:hypothetical protein
MADQPRDPDNGSHGITEVPIVVSSVPQHRRSQLGPGQATSITTNSEEHEDETDTVPELPEGLRWRDVSEKRAQDGQLSTTPLNMNVKSECRRGAKGGT